MIRSGGTKKGSGDLETCDRDELRLMETRSLLIEDGKVTPPVLR